LQNSGHKNATGLLDSLRVRSSRANENRMESYELQG
jgi:hypothetical protein